MPLDRYGVIGPNVTRSAQPDEHGCRMLRELGIRHVVKLNGDSEMAVATEAGWLGAGVDVLTFPFAVGMFDPDVEKARQIVAEMTRLARLGAPVHVHCTLGRDRTGFVAGVYQLVVLRLPLTRVLEEFHEFGARGWVQLLDHEIEGALKACAAAEGLA